MKSQQGVTGSMVVLIILFIGALGFGGWVLYSTLIEKDEPAVVQPGEFPNNDNISSDTAEGGGEGAEQTHRANEWLLFETKDFSVRLPDGWRFLHQTDGDVLYSECTEARCITLTKGTDAVVTKTEGGRDGVSGMFVAYDKNLSEPRTFVSAEKSGSIISDDGVAFDVYKTTTTVESELGTPPVGTVTYQYYRKVNDSEGLYISFSQYPGVADVRAIVEEAVNSATVK